MKIWLFIGVFFILGVLVFLIRWEVTLRATLSLHHEICYYCESDIEINQTSSICEIHTLPKSYTPPPSKYKSII